MGSTDDPIKMSQQYLQLKQLRKIKNKNHVPRTPKQAKAGK